MGIIRVVINETHTLMVDQISAIKKWVAEKWMGEWIGDWVKELLGEEVHIVLEKIPAEGMVLAEIKKLSKKLSEGRETIVEERETIVIASPIPALMSMLAADGTDFFVLHNDKREKKELPNGKIIMTVAKEGWVIV